MDLHFSPTRGGFSKMLTDQVKCVLEDNGTPRKGSILKKAEWLRDLENRGIISPATPQTFSQPSACNNFFFQK